MLGEDGEAAGAGASGGDALPPLRLSHVAAFVRRGLPAIPADDLARVAAAASAAGDAVARLGDRMDQTYFHQHDIERRGRRSMSCWEQNNTRDRPQYVASSMDSVRYETEYPRQSPVPRVCAVGVVRAGQW